MNRVSMLVESLENRRFLSASPTIDPATGDDGSPVAVPIAIINPGGPIDGTSQGVTLYQYAHQHFTKKVGDFQLKVSDLALNAVINWGDGTHSAGDIEGSYATGHRYVEGSHTYNRAGVFNVDIKIFASPLGSPIHPTSPIIEFHSTINARTLKPTNGGVSLTETAGQSFTASLGQFQFKTVDQILNAVIDWGDGTHSAGKLVGSLATGKWTVQGTHTYKQTGLYKVDVQIFSHLAGNPAPTFVLPVTKFTSVIDVKGKA
ncbi:MAG TPA: hypothetical protein VHS31_08460 [Tepidisphaeraceae bacterium]|jgi:hypothetical protein|nr:hypothetical protein [Tepidisphaeraceae bacterium]